MTRFTRNFLFLALISPAICNAQDTISWKPHYKLKWDDFKGEANLFSPYNAITSAGINYYFTIHKNKSCSFLVCNVFYKKKSWFKTRSGYLLVHEQGHYDIAEIFARKLRKDFEVYRLNPITIEADLKYIWDSMIKKKEVMNLQYDKETNYGESHVKQEIWLKKIADELNRLARWADQ